jgi:predicted nucleotidyltransferase
MATKTKIKIPGERVAEFCRKHHIRRLSFFGSVISDHFTQGSDVDVLIEFEQGRVVGLLRLASIEIELSDILGHKVDLRTPADLSRYFRADVLSVAEVQYVEG